MALTFAHFFVQMRLCPLLPREAVLQRAGPWAVHVDQQKSADESEVLVEVRLIGGARRTFHGPKIVHQYARERDKHDQTTDVQRV